MAKTTRSEDSPGFRALHTDIPGFAALHAQHGAMQDSHRPDRTPPRTPPLSPRSVASSKNKIPKGALSSEADELRRLLRQDMEDLLRGIVGEEMQNLRRDLREWPCHKRVPESPLPRRPRFPHTPEEPEARSPLAVVAGDDAAGCPLVPPLQPLNGDARDEIDQLPCPTGSRVQGSTRMDQGPLPLLASDAAPAAEPDGLAPARGSEGAGLAGVGPEKLDQKASDGAQVKQQVTQADVSSLAPGDQQDEDQENQAVRWEWERSNKTWKPYKNSQSETIERGWQSGMSRVRVRSGQEGKTPMEIYFVDMVQLDPESGNVRRIRRLGGSPWYTRPRRWVRRATYALETGEPIWESLESYRERQSTLASISGTSLGTASHIALSWPLDGKTPKHTSERMSYLRLRCRRAVQDHKLFKFSMAMTLGWCVWAGIDAQQYPKGASIYEKDAKGMAVELFFTVVFLVELAVRAAACTSKWECLGDAWIRIDALCVLGSLVDVIFVPCFIAVSRSGDEYPQSELAVVRVLRLYKLLRILRLSRASVDVDIFLRGIWSGLRQAGIVWAILIVLLYIFSMLLRTYASDEVREANFGSVGLAMNRLFVAGILLDGVEDLLADMLSSSDGVGYTLMFVFIVITQYIILNVLIGIMASVATEVRQQEKARSNLAYLRTNLQNTLGCYIHHDGMISRNEFGLIVKNADVNHVLRNFGAALAHLASMEESLFAEANHITFESLFEAISHMNEKRYPTVKDIYHVQDALQQSLHTIDGRLAAAGFRPHRATPGSPGNGPIR